MPKRDKLGNFHFADFPQFTPNKSPKEMFSDGVFGGTYFRPIYSHITKLNYANVIDEFPKNWFPNPKKFATNDVCDISINKYGVKSGTSLRYWEQKGWIVELDPYGWVQWYCRFFKGRRSYDDERQIKRWLQTAGPKSRFRLRLINMIKAKNSTYDDITISPVIRQLLLQWAFELKHI